MSLKLCTAQKNEQINKKISQIKRIQEKKTVEEKKMCLMT